MAFPLFFLILKMATLANKITDFLSLMHQCYDKEMAETPKCQEINEGEDQMRCQNCLSAVCLMVQRCNKGLECWQLYLDDPYEIYRYWFTGKVLPLIKKNES